MCTTLDVLLNNTTTGNMIFSHGLSIFNWFIRLDPNDMMVVIFPDTSVEKTLVVKRFLRRKNQVRFVILSTFTGSSRSRGVMS